MDKIPFVDGTKISNAKVTINEQEYEVTPAQYSGTTPVSAFNLNKMQDNIENTLVKVSATEKKQKSNVWIQHGDSVEDDIKVNDNGVYNSINLPSKNIQYNNTSLHDFLDNYTSGKAKEKAVANSYVRLFTLNMSSIYKDTFIMFLIHDSQGGWYSSLVGLGVKKNASADELVINTFKALQYNGTVTDKLYAIVTSMNKVEVYAKMSGSQSPTINIIGVSKISDAISAGKIVIDCETVVSILPTGTQKIVTSLL